MRAALIVIVVVFSIFFMISRCSHHQPPTRAGQSHPIEQRQDALDQIVLLQPLKENATKDYEAIELSASGGIPPQEVAAAIRSTLWWKLRDIIERQADDEGQLLWVNAYLQQLENAKNHGDCFAISFPLYSKTSPDEVRALLYPSTQQKAAEALTYMLTHHGVHSTVDSMQAPEGWSVVSERLSHDYGNDADLINAGSTAEDKNKQCDVVISMFESILALPDEQRGRVIRWILDKHISVAVF